MSESEELVQRAERTEHQQSVVSEQQYKVWGMVRIVVVVTFFLTIISMTNVLLTHRTQNEIQILEGYTQTLGVATEETKRAAVEARDTLLQALEDLEENQENNELTGSTPAAIAEALRAVARIEDHLCGGRCE